MINNEYPSLELLYLGIFYHQFRKYVDKQLTIIENIKKI